MKVVGVFEPLLLSPCELPITVSNSFMKMLFPILTDPFKISHPSVEDAGELLERELITGFSIAASLSFTDLSSFPNIQKSHGLRPAEYEGSAFLRYSSKFSPIFVFFVTVGIIRLHPTRLPWPPAAAMRLPSFQIRKYATEKIARMMYCLFAKGIHDNQLCG
jgi:hypothetical protein